MTESVNRERGRLELFAAVLKSDGVFSKRKAGSSSFQARISRGMKLLSQYAGVRSGGTSGTYRYSGWSEVGPGSGCRA